MDVLLKKIFVKISFSPIPNSSVSSMGKNNMDIESDTAPMHPHHNHPHLDELKAEFGEPLSTINNKLYHRVT
jgi:hypothetical protein